MASLRFPPDSRMTGNWYGEGQLQLSTDFCVASTSGRFRLRVEPFNGLAVLSAGDGATAMLTTDAGSSDTVPITSGVSFDLTGRNLADAVGCETGTNARLVIIFPEHTLTASQAGSYFDNLQISVEPS